MSNIWPYLAGIVDGEGSFSIYYNTSCRSYNGRVTVPNTSMKLMKWLIKNFGGRFDTFYPENMHGFNRKPLHRWEPSGKKNREKLVLGLLPHLVIKQEQAKCFLEFLRLGYGEGEKRSELMKRISYLNHNEDESVTTNTSNIGSDTVKIEPELMGDYESAPAVTLGVE